jgi:hypothetical protein
MSAIRHEHRTLPVLITLGVLLGAGLALASPAGRRSPQARPTPAPSTSPSPRGSASPTGVGPSATTEPKSLGDRRCEPVQPTPGWAAGPGPLAHALHVIAVGCASDHGKALQKAIPHLIANAGRGGQPRGHAPGGTHGDGDKAAGGRHGGTDPSGGRHGGKDASGSEASSGASSGDGEVGVDVVHGKGNDGEHGKDTHEPARGTPDGPGASRAGGGSAEHRNDRRPGRPSAAAEPFAA